MISVVLAAGRLPTEFARFIFSDSPLRIPLGNRASIEVVITRELELSEKCVVVVNDLQEVPRWLKNKLPKVHWVERLTEPAGSIGKSLLSALDSALSPSADQSLRVVFADTLSEIVGLDRVAVAKTDLVEDWTFAPESLARDVVDPRSRVVDPRIITGAFSFSQLELFRDKLRSALESLSGDESAEPLWLSLREYAASEAMSLEYFDDVNWVDFGHIHSYFSYRRQSLTGRATNNFTENGIFIKKNSSHVKKLRMEANWFGEVPADLFEFLPRVSLGASTGYSIQFLQGLSLSEMLLFSEPDPSSWDWVVRRLDDWLAASSACVNPNPDGNASEAWFVSHFSSRTSQLSDWVSSHGEDQLGLFPFDPRGFRVEMERLCQLLGNSKSVLVHGDLILSNIMANAEKKSLKLIDPRGGFDVESVYGPQLYDWAKLAQGIWGRYEELVTGQFTLEGQGKRQKIDFWSDTARMNNYEVLQAWFMSRCPDPENAIKLAGLLLLSACPFHFEDKDRVVAMAIMGLDLLGAN